jgi:PadR family transcriptional regulator, regulatory protein PadR
MDAEYVEMWERQVRKGLVEFVLLSLLAAERLYPPELVARSAKLGLGLPAGTIYPVLSRLRKEGLLEVHVEEAPAGPPRKYYRINAAGRELLEAMRPVVEGLIPPLRRLLGPIAKEDE